MKKIALTVLAFVTPMFAFAQNGQQLYNMIQIVQNIFGYLIPLLIVVGVAYTMWGIIKFATNTDEEERAQAKFMILWGVIGLFAMVSLWGGVGLLQQVTGVGGGALNSNQIPCVIHTGVNNGC